MSHKHTHTHIPEMDCLNEQGDIAFAVLHLKSVLSHTVVTLRAAALQDELHKCQS